MLLSNFFLLYSDYWKLLRIVHVMSINGKTISGTPNSARSSVLWTILNLLLVFSESWDNRATSQLDSKNSCLQEEVETSTLIHMGVNTEGRQTVILRNWEELSYLKRQNKTKRQKLSVRDHKSMDPQGAAGESGFASIYRLFCLDLHSTLATKYWRKMKKLTRIVKV